MVILLLCYYGLLVPASKSRHQASIYEKEKLKMLVHIVQKRQFCGIPQLLIPTHAHFHWLKVIRNI